MFLTAEPESLDLDTFWEKAKHTYCDVPLIPHDNGQRLFKMLTTETILIPAYSRGLVTTTFEGAHQDHDASAVISRELGKFLRVEVIEVSTYPQWFSKFYSFKVMKPQQLDKSIEFSRTKVLSLTLKLIKGYRTQRLTWLGLATATIAAYAFRTYHSALPMPVSHLNRCFYETRGRSQQSVVLEHLRKYIQVF